MKNKIKIAQIMGKWIGGGVEAVVMNYFRYIDKEKFEFHFICDSDSTDIPYQEIEKLGGKVIIIPPYQKVIKYHQELKKVLKEGNYQIVHSHVNTLSVFPLFAAWCCKVPIRIAHSHSTTNKKEWKKNLIKLALRPFSKVFANRYMACTEHAGRWMFGNKIYDKGNVYLLNNAIELEKFVYDEKIRNDVRRELNIKNDTLVIGHIGRFVQVKNHDFIIDVVAELNKVNSNIVLLLVGQGILESKIKEKVNNFGLNDCVKFLGQREDVNRLYQAFDIFLLPSLYEGLGMVLIEAQTSGLPCICSNKVPKVVKVTNDVSFVSLEDEAKVWIKEIDKFRCKKRTNSIINVGKAGYDIKKEVINLEKKYIELGEVKWKK